MPSGEEQQPRDAETLNDMAQWHDIELGGTAEIIVTDEELPSVINYGVASSGDVVAQGSPSDDSSPPLVDCPSTIDHSERLEDLVVSRRPPWNGDDDDDFASDSVEEVSLNDEHEVSADRAGVHDCHQGSVGSSWDSIAGKRSVEESDKQLITHHTAINDSATSSGDVVAQRSPSNDSSPPLVDCPSTIDRSERLEDLVVARRPTWNGHDDDDFASDSVELESLNDEHKASAGGAGIHAYHQGSFGSSWDSIAGKRSVEESDKKLITHRTAKPSLHSSLRAHGDSMSSFDSGFLSKCLSISYRERAQLSASFVSSIDDDDEELLDEERQTEEQEPREETPEQWSFREFWVWCDDWVRRKLQWFYVFATLYVGPVCFALYAPHTWVTVLFYTSIACVTFVNGWMVCETVCSIFYTRRMRNLHHVTRPKLIGERRLGSIVCAYLPNELSVLIQTVKAISGTIHELPEGTTLDIVLAHNGGKKEQRIALLEDLRKIELELPPRVMVHELNVLSSRSKAENVNAALGFFSELGKIRQMPFTQFAMYDADHQPIPEAWRYALETMQDQKADMVMGRCCVADGIKTIAIEFDILYSVGHAGGRYIRRFGFFGGSNGYWDATTLTETGMDEGMLTEDVDSSFRAQSAGHFMTYDPTIVSYEESPPNFSGLFKQRLRWAQGWFEVTLRQITLPFRPAPGLNLWSRFCLFLLLPFRELYVYLSSFTVPIAIVYLSTRCGWECVDYRLLAFAAFCLLVPIVMTIVAWNLTKDRYLDIHYRMPTLTPIDYIKYIVISYVYELLKIHLTVMGHIRHVLGLNKWVVTKRKTTSEHVAPTMSAAMIRTIVPEMLIRHSPFALSQSKRQMFTGTYDENRDQPIDHCITTEKPTRTTTDDDESHRTITIEFTL